MNKKIIRLIILSFALFVGPTVNAQSLPTKEWAATNANPLVFYISGDGGFNKFSMSLCGSLNKKGFDVVALNSKSYFWNKKTPEQTSSDISNYLSKKLAGRKNQEIIMVGYSFGADVLPFILNRLSKNIADRVAVSFLIASSGSTDFEIHWSDMFGGNIKRSMDVVNEINQLGNSKVVLIGASDDGNLNVKKITLKKYTREVLPGGHHFDGDTEEIVRVIIRDTQ